MSRNQTFESGKTIALSCLKSPFDTIEGIVMISQQDMAKLRFSSFEEYLAAGDDLELEGRYQLIDGKLVQVRPELLENNSIASNLYFLFAQSVRRKLLRPYCEIQVPVLRKKDPENQFPHLVILRPEHLDLMENRLTITLNMPPPQLIAEVQTSPSPTRHQIKTFVYRLAQYQARRILEYWGINPRLKTVKVFQFAEQRVDTTADFFEGDDRILSPTFPDIEFTVDQVFSED